MPAVKVILLVDDDDSARAAARRMLERLAFEVVAVDSGAKAVETMRQDPGRFACTVLDLGMPEMDGERCFRELRQLRPDLPVLVTSGSDEAEMASRLLSETGAAFLQKPYPRSVLAGKLQELIGD